MEQVFQRDLVLDLEKLQKLCKGRSRRSLFRDLKALGYLSSYSHAGKFYTLKHIPKFNKWGLWDCRGALFSKFGTLKTTVWKLIVQSKDGLLYEELRQMLRIRVQNTLNELIAKELISRVVHGGVFLYLSTDQETAASQLSLRKQKDQIELPAEAPVDKEIVIEILLELLKTDTWDASNLVKILRARGVTVKKKHIDNVLQSYNLSKKKPEKL